MRGVLVWLLWAGPAGGSEVVLDLRHEVLLRQPQITLGALAEVGAADDRVRQAFAGMVLGGAPLAGQVALRSRAELEQALRGQALALDQTIVWHGAATVNIRSESQWLDSARLLDVARRRLQQDLGGEASRLEVRLATPLPDMAAPSGELEYRARLVDGSRLRSRMPVWVDVMAQGTVYRSVVVPLAVSAYRQVYVARRPLPAGAEAGAGDFAEREAEVAQLPHLPLAPGTLAGGGRVRQPLAAGQVVTRQQISPPGMVQRGDRVRLLLAAGGIELETGAVAQDEAVTGQLVKVKPEKSNDMVTARVVAPGVVRMEGR